jgi:regulatory protein
MSEAAIEAASVAYLARFASSSGRLRQILTIKVRRSADYYGDDPGPLIAAIDALIGRLTRSGILDDAAWAEARTARLRRRGASARAIAAGLAAKGIQADLVSAVLPDSREDDRAAAASFARRRRLGPYRPTARAEHRMRDLAALGRAGFDYGVAVEIVDAADAESLTAACDGDRAASR